MKAIQTRYLPATNTLGARIVATSHKNKVVISYDDSIETGEAHKKAAFKLCRKLNWGGSLVWGSTEDGFVFVFVDTWDSRDNDSLMMFDTN